MTDETQIHQETASDIESSETIFSRDDWKPGTIDRSRGAEVLTTGDVLFGAYEITGKLGEGGMGAVFSARHISLGSLRAIKVMNATLSLNLDAVERFHREAKALLDVHHPAVVRCHDLLRDESGSIFLVMELIEGIPLSDRMKQSPLNEEELRQLALRLGAGLAAAHAQGVIHRDIAPDNVVLPEGRADRAKLVDFGIAKVLRVGEETMTAGFKGKLAFASPEQLGFYDSEIGPASDFFSLGLLLCGAALGKRIDMGKSFATAVEARRKPLSIPSEVPRSVRPGIEKLLTLDPSIRPKSVDGLFDPPKSSSISPIKGIAIAAGLIAGIGLGLALLRSGGLSTGNEPSTTSQHTTGDIDSIDVALPMPEAEQDMLAGREVSPEAAEVSLRLADESVLETAAAEATQILFNDLKNRLRDARNSSLVADTQFGVSPNPVQDSAHYTLEISADCSCYPLVFFMDANTDQIDLLYPNPNDPIQLLESGMTLRVPSFESNYAFEAEYGPGVDRLKLILLPERVDFPSIAGSQWETIRDVEDLGEGGDQGVLSAFLGESQSGEAFWSASPTQPENLEELSSLLDRLDLGLWSSAETILHVIR
jgi:serine/threonine protein kinase